MGADCAGGGAGLTGTISPVEVGAKGGGALVAVGESTVAVSQLEE